MPLPPPNFKPDEAGQNRRPEGFNNVRMRMYRVPTDITTKELYKIFSKYGDIDFIDLVNNDGGHRIDQATIIFSVLHKQTLRSQRSYSISLPRYGSAPIVFGLQFPPNDQQNVRRETQHRLHSGPTELSIDCHSVSFGVRNGPERARILQTVPSMQHLRVKVSHNHRSRSVDFNFPLEWSGNNVYQYLVKISHMNPQSVWELTPSKSDANRMILVISVDNVPEYFVKHNNAKSHNPMARTWSPRHAWFRKTDIARDKVVGQQRCTTLRKSDSYINIGRWRLFRLDLDLSTVEAKRKYREFFERLEGYGITIQKSDLFQFDYGGEDHVWAIVDNDSLTSMEPSGLSDLRDDSRIWLPFAVRYQLEACISEGLLNEYDIPRKFIEQLRDMHPHRAVSSLEWISVEGERVYDPLLALGKAVTSGRPRSKRIKPEFAWIRSAVVTPTTIHYNMPVLEISNRITRQFAQHHDRFLRVRFEEERPRGPLYARLEDDGGRTAMEEIYERIRDTLRYGINVGDRHYEFLGFGNSQFRENGAYFFASDENISAPAIRAWMGDFSHIKSVSKHAARIGQCFSTTRAVHGALADVREIPDIWTEDKKHCFTDGVGKITKPMAQLSAMETHTGIKSTTRKNHAVTRGELPSVIQFRAGGSKGVLAVHEDDGPSQQNRRLTIYIRPSQYKFPAKSDRLEVVRWSQFSAAHLNRQIICVLSALGVPDQTFVSLMKQQLTDIDNAMNDEKTAIRLLSTDIDPNMMSEKILQMVQDGFQASEEPFLCSLLRLWRAVTIKSLKEKAKILVSQGAVLLGCVDEYRVLQGHFDSSNALPEIFVQLSKGKNGAPEVITGPMILARNPSLHPGDARVVNGVDAPRLHHLKDCVVLPQTGDRDLASMCSGGDLDGDDYIVIWDELLIPPQRNYRPMDYTAPPELKVVDSVTVDNITDFFVTYMKNNTLGTIANAHLAHADREPEGVKSEKCLRLAALHSLAVDFPKSGHPARMTPDLQARTVPHFMDPNKVRRTYHSKKVCGQLFDLVERVAFIPDYNAPFDARILDKVQDYAVYREETIRIKSEYDVSMRRIMKHYDIATEAEVWSTYVMHHSKHGSNFKFHEVIGEAAGALKDTYKDECYNAAGGRHSTKIYPFVAAIYQTTWNQIREFNETKPSKDEQTHANKPPLISFPWLFHKILGTIAAAESMDKLVTSGLSSAWEEVKTSKSVGEKTGTDCNAAANTLTTQGLKGLHNPDHSGSNTSGTNPRLNGMENTANGPRLQPQDLKSANSQVSSVYGSSAISETTIETSGASNAEYDDKDQEAYELKLLPPPQPLRDGNLLDRLANL